MAAETTTDARELVKGRETSANLRIINGNEVRGDQYGWIVALQRKLSNGQYRTFCAGSVVKNRWIVTAAHCHQHGAPSYPDRLVIGRSDTSRGNGGVVLYKSDIRNIHNHPQYDRYKNDIGLIELKRDLPSSVPHIVINKAQQTDKPGEKACVAGWGYTKVGSGIVQNKLREVCLPIMSIAECRRKGSGYDDRVSNQNLCMLGDRKQNGYFQDACSGDSGGPQFAKLASGQEVLVGVVSWGRLCGVYPGVYSRVSSHQQWIQSMTGRLPDVIENIVPPKPEEPEEPKEPEEPQEPEVDNVTCRDYHGKVNECRAHYQCQWRRKKSKCYKKKAYRN